VVIEHLWLGVLGGALGLLLAWSAVRAILARWGGQIPRAAEVVLDGRVFAFTFLAALVAGVLAGTLPALRSSRVSLKSMLATGGRTSARGGRNLAGASLVSVEIALAFLLLCGAGLLIRSFRSLLDRDLGIDTNVATAQVGLSGPLYAADSLRRAAYWSALIETYRAIPGVRAVGLTNFTPLGLTGQGFIDIGGRDVAGAGAVYRTVNEDFFSALGLPLLAGRVFDKSDGMGTPRVAVINKRMAVMYWPDENPIGKQVRARNMEPRPGGQAAWLTIVGIVGDLRTYGLATEPRPEMYAVYRQTPLWTNNMTALVRGTGPATRLLPELRLRARSIDAHVAVDVGTIDDLLRSTLAPRVLTMSLLSAFAAIAVLLAALGIYGVLSYAVTQRTRELAVRAALGAGRGQLLVVVLRAGLRVVVLGAFIGLVAAVWLTRTMASMLVDVTPGDPVTYAAAFALLMVTALAAIVVPARRATRLEPIIALQAE